MPYKRKGKCVYKSTGEKVGCSDTVEKAKKYIKALYASELNESLPNTITPEEQAKVKEFMDAFMEDKQTWIDKYGLEQANFVMYKTAVKKAKNSPKEKEEPEEETKKEETVSENLKNKIKKILKESFPDLTGDGKVTKADILKGRGVDLDEDLDVGHQDNEPHMLKADLYRIGKYAMELYKMMDKYDKMDGEVDFPHWWQSKIIKSKEMLVSAKHYLDFEVKEPEIDTLVKDLDSAEDMVD